ncbi:hypothetical protein IFM89_020231 [Coptis chinensis]|uniref:Uncharacterized protein n=1 Tax=Coptis chinensis TaxID=261450 RepID=A0A835LS56_9MAGN|nr:hypothetical protein IFM89_020231 [Coptis chinensis]
MVALLLLWTFWFYINQNPNSSPTTFSHSLSQLDSFPSLNCTHQSDQGVNQLHDPTNPTFYDEPNISYTIEKPIKNWDKKRSDWLKHHPSYAAGVHDRILLLSGSQSTPCQNPIGDHLLLRFFKNKVDYCRIHGYKNHNLIVHGWPHLIYEKKSWVALNAGIFLIRNCQWSMDFMDVWASMGPISPNYDNWGKILKSTFKEKIFPESCDQSALVYLLLKEKEKWAGKIYLEHEYYFEGYWVEIVETLDNINKKYMDIEKRVPKSRRRHAEKVSEFYGALREKYLKEAGYGRGSWRRPFITHFAGCQPCGGAHSKMYSWENCSNGMQKVLNFADNQVLHNFGFTHHDLLDSSLVSPLPFDFPS